MSLKAFNHKHGFSKKETILGTVFWSFVITIGLVYCTRETETTTTPEVDVSALNKMAVVFIGDHTRTEIETILLPLMSSQNVPQNEDELNRWGSVLVRMRKDSGVTEMEIMRCMQGVPTIKFPDSVAICGTTLAQMRR